VNPVVAGHMAVKVDLVFKEQHRTHIDQPRGSLRYQRHRPPGLAGEPERRRRV